MEAGFATKSYQYHLLGLAYNHKYGLSNNFNFSHLKQRIIMMNKKKSNAAGHIKYALFVLPAFALLVAGNISCSQGASEKQDAKEETVAPDSVAAPTDGVAKDEVFMVAEQMPEFPGGMKELLKFLQNNLKYPENAMKNNVQGRVIVQFVVEKDGTLTEFTSAKLTEDRLDMISVLTELGFAKSNSEARRILKEGGASVNGVKVQGEDAAISKDDLLHGRFAMVRRGKKNQGAVELT